MGRRIYTVPMNSVSIAAAQDVFTVKCAATKGAQIHHIQMSAGGVVAAAEIAMVLKRLTATVTVTGGTSVTPGIVDFGDTLAAASTVTINNTTIATTSGSTQNLEYFQWNVLLPFDYMPGPEDEDRDVADISQAMILNLPSSPGATTVCSGFLKYREMP